MRFDTISSLKQKRVYHILFSSLCVALSPGIKVGIVRRGVSEEWIEIVPNGCDLELFEVDKDEA